MNKMMMMTMIMMMMMNMLLYPQRNPPIKVENLFEEVKDGVVLLSLLEVLSGEKLPGTHYGEAMLVNDLSQGLNIGLPNAGLDHGISRSESRASTMRPGRHWTRQDTICSH
ncbi:nesprin-1 [Elysia marginata]|uniref:Nesprin-1 n=1 Tax=Elysia marginata TaxID=1093978 RepID=A0AAV4HS12_9GAST|nr:nesprin-1 [Elysia marginata]